MKCSFWFLRFWVCAWQHLRMDFRIPIFHWSCYIHVIVKCFTQLIRGEIFHSLRLDRSEQTSLNCGRVTLEGSPLLLCGTCVKSHWLAGSLDPVLNDHVIEYWQSWLGTRWDFAGQCGWRKPWTRFKSGRVFDRLIEARNLALSIRMDFCRRWGIML